MKKKKPKSKVIKCSLDETMDERRRWIENEFPTAEDVVILYPPLRVERWVYNYYRAILHLSVVNLHNRYEESFRRLLTATVLQVW